MKIYRKINTCEKQKEEKYNVLENLKKCHVFIRIFIKASEWEKKILLIISGKELTNLNYILEPGWGAIMWGIKHLSNSSPLEKLNLLNPDMILFWVFDSKELTLNAFTGLDELAYSFKYNNICFMT